MYKGSDDNQKQKQKMQLCFIKLSSNMKKRNKRRKLNTLDFHTSIIWKLTKIVSRGECIFINKKIEFGFEFQFAPGARKKCRKQYLQLQMKREIAPAQK